MSIRKQVGKLLGYTIPEGTWSKSFNLLQKEGRITNRHLLEILVILLEREEEREQNTSL